MSASRRRQLSATYRPPPPSAPQRPARPFISLDDPYTQNYFNRRHIRNHLKRAGLLTKQGEIVTQAEYDDRQTDVAIGRENQRKIDDVLTDVLNDMAKEHWGYAREYIDKLRNDLIHEFQRIEEQYRRRKQFISIRHIRDGSTRSIQVNGTTQTPASTLPNFPHPSPEREPLDLNQLQQGLEDVKVKPTNLNARLDMTQNSDIDVSRLEESIRNLEKNFNNIREQLNILDRKFDEEKTHKRHVRFQTKSSEMRRKSLELNEQSSSIVENLPERIAILETAFQSLSIKSFQAKIDKAIRTSEEKAIHREHIIENIARNLDGKINRVDTQIAEILTLLGQIPQLNIDGDVIQSIQNVIRNVEKVQEDDHQWITLAREAVEKVNRLENFIRENETILSNMQRSISELDSRLNEHITKTSGREYQPRSDVDSIPARVISTKSQTTMPFIERLPAFDMLVENE